MAFLAKDLIEAKQALGPSKKPLNEEMTFYKSIKIDFYGLFMKLSVFEILGAYVSHNENFVHTWALKEPGVRSREPEENLKG